MIEPKYFFERRPDIPDYCSYNGSRTLANAISKYWGVDIEFETTQFYGSSGRRAGEDHRVYCLTSDLVNGLPKGYHGPLNRI